MDLSVCALGAGGAFRDGNHSHGYVTRSWKWCHPCRCRAEDPVQMGFKFNALWKLDSLFWL